MRVPSPLREAMLADPLVAISATEMSILEILRGMTRSQADAWLRMGRRLADGMPMTEEGTLSGRSGPNPFQVGRVRGRSCWAALSLSQGETAARQRPSG